MGYVMRANSSALTLRLVWQSSLATLPFGCWTKCISAVQILARLSALKTVVTQPRDHSALTTLIAWIRGLQRRPI